MPDPDDRRFPRTLLPFTTPPTTRPFEGPRQETDPAHPPPPHAPPPLGFMRSPLEHAIDLLVGATGLGDQGPAGPTWTNAGQVLSAALPFLGGAGKFREEVGAAAPWVKRILWAGEQLGPEAKAAEEAGAVSRVTVPHGTPPAERVGERLIVSTRVPWAKSLVPHPEGAAPLVTGIDEAAQDPAFLKKLATQIRLSPMVASSEAGMNDRGVLDLFADRAAQNMDLAIQRQDPRVIARSGAWYPGGHRIANEIAARTGITGDQAAALIASQSPSKEWPQNIDLAQRLADYWQTFRETNPAYGPEHFKQFRDNQRLAADEWVKTWKLTGDRELAYRSNMRGRIADAKRYVGTRWEDLPLEQRAQLIRTHSELHDPQSYPIYAPEGTISHPIAMKADGTPRKLVWQSYPNLTRGLSILEDGSVENLSRQLGEGHKVRSFFNNLNVPADPRSATVDTHHVGLSHLQPMGGQAPEVRAVMSGVGNAQTGISGAHPVYRDALVRAALARGEVPSTTQAIGWETIKGTFSPKQRSDPKFKAAVDDVWNAYASGRLTLEDVHARIAELAGPIRLPDWIQD
jgi:hypothetical protein